MRRTTRPTATPVIATLLVLLAACHDDDSHRPPPPAVSPFLLFGHDGSHDIELYRSNGTASGTYLLRDIGTTDTDVPQYVRTYPGPGTRWAFIQQDQPWLTDGTPDGTVPAALPFDWTSISSPELPRDAWLGDRLLFTADGRLWVLDTLTGSVASLTPDTCTVPISQLDETSVRLGNVLYFFGAGCGDDATTMTLWQTDGTPGGTTAVADLPGTAWSVAPGRPVGIGNRFVFVFDDGTSGQEPWVSDGTEAGTQRLADLITGSEGSDPFVTTAVVDGRLLLRARDTDNPARERLYATDGTPAGTTALPVDPPPRATTLAGPNPVLFDGLAYYPVVIADGDSTGHWLRVTDGTPAGTRTLFRFGMLASEDVINSIALYAAGGHLYARLIGDAGHTELQHVDTIAESAFVLADSNTLIQPWAAVGQQLLFLEMIDDDMRALWRTDGTPASTRQLITFRQPSCPVPYEDNLVLALFLCLVGNGELVRSDTLLFIAHDPVAGNELWRTDGTTHGTVRVTDLWPGDGAGVRGIIGP